jgi:ABC-type Mn2+/Zn2+ transport system permease subunit
MWAINSGCSVGVQLVGVIFGKSSLLGSTLISGRIFGLSGTVVVLNRNLRTGDAVGKSVTVGAIIIKIWRVRGV